MVSQLALKRKHSAQKHMRKDSGNTIDTVTFRSFALPGS